MSAAGQSLAGRPTPPPPVLHTLEDIGLPAERVEHLLIKTLFSGELTGLEIGRASCRERVYGLV